MASEAFPVGVFSAPAVLAIGGEPDEGFDPTLGWGDYGHPLFQSTLLRLDPDLQVVGASPRTGRSTRADASGI